MTFWAKLLTVIILVLSIAFAAMSAVIFAKREDFRTRLSQEVTAHEKDNAEKSKKIEGLTADLRAKDADIAQKKADLDAAQLQIGSLTNEVKKLNGDLKQRADELAREQDNVARVTQSNNTLVTMNDKITKENKDLATENRKQVEALAAANDRANKLENANKELASANDKLGKDLAKAQEIVKQNEDVFAELAKRNIEARTVIAGLNALPDIKLKNGDRPSVVTVDPESNLVVINAGRNQGVLKNFDFTIFRNDKFVAQVTVFDVQDDISAARVVRRAMPIQRGDHAWTRLQ